ncbi:hypothetical protein ACFPYI_16910 [Halomarina salina]|uniref:Uncharacterized protein n=1 Tax=Halomarina salina TaxID=1872699 RepID=A0ABD5RQV9_9EURY|nr:hypothetical protein [Halomarina salina]
MPRNTLMATVGVLSVAALVTAVLGTYRVFSYVAALLIVTTVVASSAERGVRELDVSPYAGLGAGLLVTFVAGLSAIWLLWTPGSGEFTYTLGMPQATLSYLVFIWILPLLGAVYYALLFPAIGGDDVVDDIMAEARAAQADGRYPLTPSEDPTRGDD